MSRSQAQKSDGQNSLKGSKTNIGQEGQQNNEEGAVQQEHHKKAQPKFLPQILQKAIEIKTMTLDFVSFLMDDIMVVILALIFSKTRRPGKCLISTRS